jgi:hypothetical protein
VAGRWVIMHGCLTGTGASLASRGAPAYDPAVTRICSVRYEPSAETFALTVGHYTPSLAADERVFAICQYALQKDPALANPEGGTVAYKLITIKFGEVRPPPRERRCKRTDRTQALICFDSEESRIVATLGWLDIQMVDVPNGVRINAQPTLLRFPISYN